MAWVFLLATIVLEVAGTTALKLSEEFTKIVPTVLILVFYGLSFGTFTLALRGIDLAVAKVVWGGLSAVLISVVAVVFFSESMTLPKIISIGVIVVGVVGLNLSGGGRL